MDQVSQIRQFVHDEFLADTDLAEFDDDYDLLESGLLDSLRLLKIISWLEQDLGIALADENLVPANFRSIRLICDLLDAAGHVSNGR
jgi:acyl carrier protein